MEPILRLANNTDAESIANLISRENHLESKKYIDCWYFSDQQDQPTVAVVEKDGQLEGMAATNNFTFINDGEKKVVAMPQKVLTSKALRGQGFFRKMYWKTEEENLLKGVDYFVTITNEASTDIFLNKFGYEKGSSPDVHLLIANPLSILQKRKYEVVYDFIGFKEHDQLNHAFEKTREYLQWRYLQHNSSDYHILRFKKEQFLVLKKVKKGGLPFFMVMDIVGKGEGGDVLLKSALRYAFSKSCLGILFFENALTKDFAQSYLLKHVSKSHFNFLVKGKNDNETQLLQERKFNFFFGDWDFV